MGVNHTRDTDIKQNIPTKSSKHLSNVSIIHSTILISSSNSIDQDKQVSWYVSFIDSVP